jgi:hypothetical protein
MKNFDDATEKIFEAMLRNLETQSKRDCLTLLRIRLYDFADAAFSAGKEYDTLDEWFIRLEDESNTEGQERIG